MRMAFIAVALTLGGCGPIQSSTAINSSELRLADAERGGAATHARYEYAKAKAYLMQAKLKQGYGRYEIARIWAEQAAILAAEAMRIAKQRKNLERLRAQSKKRVRKPPALPRAPRDKLAPPNKRKAGEKPVRTSTPPIKRRSFHPPIMKRESGDKKK